MVTSEQIRQLSDEAAAHGDREQVELCRLALAGDLAAIAECERVINDARAQHDG